jgi:hypothetical protein
MSDDETDDLTPVERRRRVVLLCFFMRNLAFHRAGLQAEVQRNLLNPDHPNGRFWLHAHNNFIDACVLDWCKLFVGRNRKRDWGEGHWRRVVNEPDRFEADLCTTLGVTDAKFAELTAQIRRYRNTFVAHLDQERKTCLPMLELAKKSIAFLHQRLARQPRSNGDWRGLPTSAEQLDRIFTEALQEAQSVHAEALGRHRGRRHRRPVGAP